MKKRILSCLMALALCLTLLPTAALAASEHKHCLCGKSTCNGDGHGTESTTTTFDKWLASTASTGYTLVVGEGSEIYGTGQNPVNGKYVLSNGNYYLKTGVDGFESTVTIEHPIVIEGNVTICLNGKTIQSSGKDMPVFEVKSGGTLTLTDCKNDYGKVTHSGQNAAANTSINTGVNVGTGGTFNLYGGSISDNKSTRYGGVYVNGTFNMYGGKITGNVANVGGGGVYVDSKGTFNMNGGTISGNNANSSYGGGVYVQYQSSTFTMSGGSITKNEAGVDGGGVYAGGEFTMSGGSITGNEATQNGGGVYASKDFNMSGGTIGGAQTGEANKAKNGGGVYVTLRFNMSGNASIIKNEATSKGGGVCVTGSFGAFTMSDNASITDNKASDGGGVFVENGKFEMSSGTISGNTATNAGGGVYVYNSSTFTMSGGSITNNTASYGGGGVCVGGGTFTVSGGATVEGNKNNGTDNNVHLPNNRLITIGGALTGGNGSIGVTTATKPDKDKNITIATGSDYTITDADKAKFSSDDSQYEVGYDATNSQLVLKTATTTPTPPPTEHTHYLCGGDNCTKVGHTQETSMVTFQPWDKADSLPDTQGSYYLTNNVTLDKTWEPATGTVLCLNGKTITANGEFEAIKVGKNVTFTLTDCQSNQGSITHADNKYGRGMEVNGGTLNLYGGSITGNNGEGITGDNSALGGGVQVTAGTFNMYGGSISGNIGGSYCVGGGVYVAGSSSTFNLYNGEISGNRGSFGGGVEVYDGTFNMSGGSITNNTATYGGGVDMRDGVAFTMTGGEITGNTANGSIGSGVLVYGGTFTVSGSATITGNTADNVYLKKDRTITIGTGGLSGKIGVTTQKLPEKETPVTVIANTKGISGLSTHVVSDNDAYETAVEGNTIVLQVVGDTGGGTTVPVTGITLDTTTATLKVGKTRTLTATVEPSNATNPSVTWKSSDTSVATVDTNGTVTARKVGTTKITATAADGSGKFTTCEVTVTAAATPSQPGGSTGGSSSGGGGGSSSDRDSYDSNPIIKTETKNNPDGSTTKTETRRDGSVTQTTTGKDGSVSKNETKKDGSSVTENKVADGSTGTVKTDKNGQTKAETKLSGKAVEDAKKNGEAVKAPVEVEATRNSNTAPTVKVELPKGAGETEVEIPVSNAKPGTVAVLVHPDGTEEVLKNSVPTEDGIRLTVDGGATVKIIDNSKDFIDIRNHWAKDEIDFVSARGLVNGMSDTIYAPNNSTTRAQLWTILARQADADLTGGSVWYEKAQNWAKEKGVSDGANPNAAINRAQMVTMLWRAMGQPAAGGTATFIDVPADAYYANAVSWAVENGITTGVGGGRFDPTGTCTRAQIAAFLARSMK